MAPSSQLVREQLQRILASPQFADSHRPAAFLTYVVAEALAGRAKEIKQTTIGCEVFGRPATYDPRDDAVVRTVARALRAKLNEYYLAAGASDAVRIEIPKGGYAPEFRCASIPPAASAPKQRGFSASQAVSLAAVLFFTVSGSPVTQSTPGNAPTLFAEGRQRFAAGDLLGARTALEKAALAAPASAPIQAALANSLLALGLNQPALEAARKAAAHAEPLPREQELEIAAVFNSASGDHRAALESYRALLESHPDQTAYRRGLAQSQLLTGSPAACLETISHWAGSADPQLAILEAYCRAATGDFAGALEPTHRAESLARAGTQPDTYARARLLESGLLMSTEREPEARAARQEARQLCASLRDEVCELRALRLEANADLARSRPAEALAAYRSALPLARQAGSLKEVAELLDGEGYALMLLDDPAAGPTFIEALLTTQRAGSPETSLRQDMAELALRKGQTDHALLLAAQSEAEARARGDLVGENAARILHARALMATGDLQQSAAILDQVHAEIERFHLSADLPRRWSAAHADLLKDAS